MGQESSEQTDLGTLGTELQKGQSKGYRAVRESLRGAVQRERRAGSTEREQAGSRAGLTTFTERNVVIELGIPGCVNNKNLEIRGVKK